eukprot:gene22228-29293_t
MPQDRRIADGLTIPRNAIKSKLPANMVNLWLVLSASLLLLSVEAINLRGNAGSAAVSGTVASDDASIKGEAKQDPNAPWVEQVGLHPQVYYFHNFLNEAERTHMIRSAAPMMKRSQVSGDHGAGVVDNIRTSYGMFLHRKQDPVITGIEKRISLFTHVPQVHMEDIQVLRYTQGQKYAAHYDSSYDKNDEGPHHRMATFYMYLSDVEEGGETAFPLNSVWYNPAMGQSPAAQAASECARGHVHAKPKAGDAVLFYSFHHNGTMDEASMHTGCPVIKGTKWGAPVWIHIDEFMPESFGTPVDESELREPGMCSDFHKECQTWAEAGECEKNPDFMSGKGGDQVGKCRRACKACSPCGASDIACINRNRKAAGYLELERSEFEKLGVNWWFGSEPSPEL